jgi:hypothetical protein
MDVVYLLICYCALHQRGFFFWVKYLIFLRVLALYFLPLKVSFESHEVLVVLIKTKNGTSIKISSKT